MLKYILGATAGCAQVIWMVVFVSLFYNFFGNLIYDYTKGKFVYGQEPPSGESTTTECGFNYQLLTVITEVAQWGAPSCSKPQPATDNGVRDGRSN